MRPRRCVALRISLRAVAAGQSSRHRRPFLRRGMIPVPPCRRIALWHCLVSKAPSPVTVPICSAAGIWSSRWDRLGLSPLSPEVNSAARRSPVAVSIASMRRIRKQFGYEQDQMPCDCVFPTIDLAILASALRAMLARMPFPIPGNSAPLAGSPEPVALRRLDVHQQVKRARRMAARYPHRDPFLAAAQGRKVRHRPVGASHR